MTERLHGERQDEIFLDNELTKGRRPIRELRDEVESLQDALGDADKKIDNLIEENKKLAGKIKR